MLKRWLAILPVLFALSGCGGSNGDGPPVVPGTGGTGSQPILSMGRPSVSTGWKLSVGAISGSFTSRVIVMVDSSNASSDPGPTANTYSEPFTLGVAAAQVTVPLKSSSAGHKLVAVLYGYSSSSSTYFLLDSSSPSETVGL